MVITLLLLEQPIWVTHNLEIRVQNSQKKDLKENLRYHLAHPSCHTVTKKDQITFITLQADKYLTPC